MSQALQLIETILSFIVVLGILVFVHEFGHFIIAKGFRIGVPVFSLGFGPRLWGFRRRETDYRVSAVPLGGYVRMAGDESDESRTGGPEEFLSRPRWQRFLVFVAGATFNIILAIAVMTGVFTIWGRDVVVRPETYPTVVDVVEGSDAAGAGIRAGDRVVSIAGRDARDQETEVDEIVLSPDQTKPVLIEREGVRSTLSMRTGQDPVYHLGSPGWRLAQENGQPPSVDMVLGGSPADAAGLKRGDRIAAIDGHAPQGERELRVMLEQSAGRVVTLSVLREGVAMAIPVTPKDEGGRGKIGVLFSDGNRVHKDLAFGAALAASLDYNAEITRSVFQTLQRLIQRKIGMRAFSGPIEIARVSREAVRGAESFLTFLALISLQLGILNLLPIPVLDGGHILILGFEGLFRRDFSEKLKERVMTAGFVFLLAFFAVVIFYDILKARM
ncbi:MAG TPA: RIP metalloprotease RseP [Candidatus Polarisedimenticolaceae bacterium]|nr:RIP metalloprotease RseP [Candidatus Polarisedimenticolaceae bacterium]